MSEVVVLDASALAAVLLGEPGADAVAPLLAVALVNAVNVAEVLIVLQRHGVGLPAAVRMLETLAFETVAADGVLAREIAEVHGLARSRGLSLADCACLATARARHATAVTADRAWAGLEVGVAISVVR